MAKNIEMNYYNGTDYEILYPSVMMNNIGDWQSNVYSKAETDNKIDEKISNIQLSNITPWNYFKEVTLQFSEDIASDTPNKKVELINSTYYSGNEDVLLVLNGSFSAQLVSSVGNNCGGILGLLFGREGRDIIFFDVSQSSSSFSKIFNNQILGGIIFGNENLASRNTYKMYYVSTTVASASSYSTITDLLEKNSPIQLSLYNFLGMGKAHLEVNLTLTMYKRPSILGMYLV